MDWSPKQAAAASFGARGCHLLLLDGTVRSGKTECAIDGAYQWHGQSGTGMNFGFVSKSRATMMGNIEAKSRRWAAEMGIRINRHQDHWTVPSPHGGRNHYWRVIIGEGDEQAANRILGMDFNGFLFDEISLASRELLDLAQGRMMEYTESVLIGTCNPQGPDHPIKTDWIDPILRGEIPGAESYSFQLADNPIFANPKLQEAVLRRAATMSPVRIQRDLLGMWVAGTGLMYPDVTYEEPPDEPALERVVAIDPGPRTVTHALLWQRHPAGPEDGDVWYCADEWVWDTTDNEQLTPWAQIEKIIEWAAADDPINAFVIPQDGWQYRDAVEGQIAGNPALNWGVMPHLLPPDQNEIRGNEELNRQYRSGHFRVSHKCQILKRQNGRYKVHENAAYTGVEKGDKRSADGAHGCDAARYFAMALHRSIWGEILP